MTRYKRNSKSNLLTYVLLTVIVIILASSIVLYINFVLNKDEIDKDTFCSKTEEYNKHIVAIDITDKYNYIQIADIKLQFENIIKNMDIGEQIVVYFLTNEPIEKIKPALTICNPKKGTGESEFFSNPKLLEKKWKRNFYDPLSKTISQLDKQSTAPTSPIIEIVQFINILEFKNHNTGQNKLTIISDMIQNSNEFSFFKNKEQIDRMEETDFINKYRTNMSNFNLQIMLVRRDKLEHYQKGKYLDFWINYFTMQNAIIEKIIRIDG